MILLGLLCKAAALFPLYLKYRVVLTGERCKGKITGISGKQYYTAHGCLFAPFGRKQIGKEIWVFRNETYGREVFRCRDPRIEVLALVFFSAAVLCFLYA